MRVVNEFPPNIDVIRTALNPESHAIFCYGDTIYNPSGRELLPDTEHHEEVHTVQQGSNPDAWWAEYLVSSEFRLQQEIEAYAAQYKFLKDRIEQQRDKAAAEGKRMVVGANELLSWGLDSMATALAGQSYGNLLSFGEARSKIRNYAKNLQD